MSQEQEAQEAMTCARCGRFSGPEALCARCDEESVEDKGYGFMEAERPLTPDERRGEIVRFLSWLTENARVRKRTGQQVERAVRPESLRSRAEPAERSDPQWVRHEQQRGR